MVRGGVSQQIPFPIEPLRRDHHRISFLTQLLYQIHDRCGLRDVLHSRERHIPTVELIEPRDLRLPYHQVRVDRDDCLVWVIVQGQEPRRFNVTVHEEKTVRVFDHILRELFVLRLGAVKIVVDGYTDYAVVALLSRDDQGFHRVSPFSLRFNIYYRVILVKLIMHLRDFYFSYLFTYTAFSNLHFTIACATGDSSLMWRGTSSRGLSRGPTFRSYSSSMLSKSTGS